MPIYEFFCDKCNTIFNFFSRSVNTTKRPKCPKCRTRTLSRQVSMFAVTGREAERIDDNDPRQAADLMRKLTDMTGIEMGPQMQEALRRMEAGEDPEQVEAEMGDLLEEEEPFLLPGQKGRKTGRSAPAPPKRDDTLYEL